MNRIIVDTDFDGLACAVLLKIHYPNHTIKFTTPKSINKYETDDEDIIADLPKPASFKGIYFDHHPPYKGTEHGKAAQAKSCARLIYNYYKNLKTFKELVDAADNIDSGNINFNFETPAEKIAHTLSLRGSNQDNQYRKKLARLILESKTLQEISELDFVRKRFEQKQDMIKELLQKIKIEWINKWGIKFAKLQNCNRKSVIIEIYKQGADYIITTTSKGSLIISSNNFKKGVNILTIARKYGATGKGYNVYIQNGNEEIINKLIEEIAIEHNEQKRICKRF